MSLFVPPSCFEPDAEPTQTCFAGVLAGRTPKLGAPDGSRILRLTAGRQPGTGKRPQN